MRVVLLFLLLPLCVWAEGDCGVSDGPCPSGPEAGTPAHNLKRKKPELTMRRLVDNIVYQALQTHLKKIDVVTDEGGRASNQALTKLGEIDNSIAPLKLRSRPWHLFYDFIRPTPWLAGVRAFSLVGGVVGAGLDVLLGLAPGGLFGSGLVGALSCAAVSGSGRLLWNGASALDTSEADVDGASIWNCEMTSWRSSYKASISRGNDQLDDSCSVSVSVSPQAAAQSLKVNHFLNPKLERVLINYSLHSFQTMTPFNKHQIHGFVTVRHDQHYKTDVLTHYTTRNMGSRDKSSGSYTIWVQDLEGGDEAVQLDAPPQPSCLKLLTS